VDAFNTVLPKYSIDTIRRISAFLGQIAVESGELKFDKELPSKYNKVNVNDPKEAVGTLYEGRKNLGNIQKGDGPKYIGRGILQLTGRANYENMSKKLNIDLVNTPDLACDAVISTKIACEFFKEKGLLALADNWDLEKITERVNGRAKLHHELRVKYSERALKFLSEI
jgi:putative chitinase